MDTLFCKILIAHLTDYQYQSAENGKFYKGEVERIAYFDFNNEEPLWEKIIDICLKLLK